jgi:HEPN domain-containing protein
MMPPNSARRFFIMAMKDYTALKGMLDPEIFAKEIFGFHAQQAVEKGLKAWIEQRGGTAPITHSLLLLVHMLADMHEDATPWYDLVNLSSFAVQFRYEDLEPLAPLAELSRPDTIDRVGEFLTYVESLLTA